MYGECKLIFSNHLCMEVPWSVRVSNCVISLFLYLAHSENVLVNEYKSILFIHEQKS